MDNPYNYNPFQRKQTTRSHNEPSNLSHSKKATYIRKEVIQRLIASLSPKPRSTWSSEFTKSWLFVPFATFSNTEDLVMLVYSQFHSEINRTAWWWTAYQTENSSLLHLLPVTVIPALWGNMQYYFTSYFHIHTKQSSKEYQCCYTSRNPLRVAPTHVV